MASSNERGRALEFAVAQGIFSFVSGKGISIEETGRTKQQNEKHKAYFGALDKETQDSFASCAKAFANWQGFQDWISGANKVVIDRIPDNEAKDNIEMADIRLLISKNGTTETKNISVKHRHDALCHPRLPSLAEQCGIADSKIDAAYRQRYEKIWENFFVKVKSLGRKIKKYDELERKHEGVKDKFLYKPLQQNTVKFLFKYANNPQNAKAFFDYIAGKNDYYVLKNGEGRIEIKHFLDIKRPSSFKITYPFEKRLNTFLAEFDNGWQITFRIHTASSRIAKNGKIFMTEKEDPICQNLEELIKIEKISK